MKNIKNFTANANAYESLYAPHGMNALKKHKEMFKDRKSLPEIQVSKPDKPTMEVEHTQAQLDLFNCSA